MVCPFQAAGPTHAERVRRRLIHRDDDSFGRISPWRGRHQASRHRRVGVLRARAVGGPTEGGPKLRGLPAELHDARHVLARSAPLVEHSCLFLISLSRYLPFRAASERPRLHPIDLRSGHPIGGPAIWEDIMRMRQVPRSVAVAVGTAALVGTALASASAATGSPGRAGNDHGSSIKHVLLISVDGMHQQDLAWYVKNNPDSLLATLERHGLEYSGAQTPFPSDSSPGMYGQVTGGDPRVTGIYYDDTFNHDVFPAGTTNCTGPVPGTEAAYHEAIDVNQNSIDAGQGLSGLPGSILQMTSNPLQVINPANLPVDPTTCKPIFPNHYLKVNTIFNVAHDAGLRTAWSDKHPAYQAFSGPSGNGVDDFFTPEINSMAPGFPAVADWTGDNAATMEYDSFKVQAILNEIDGFNHQRTQHVGVPAIFDMNFQTLPTRPGRPRTPAPGI